MMSAYNWGTKNNQPQAPARSRGDLKYEAAYDGGYVEYIGPVDPHREKRPRHLLYISTGRPTAYQTGTRVDKCTHDSN